MFAVIKTGGKQYRVAPDDVLVVEKLPVEAGATHVFGDVLMVGDGSSVEMGAPLVGGAQVTGEVLEQRKGAKITIYKTRQRNTYMRKKGHRQQETVIRITEIASKLGKATGEAKSAPKTARKADAPKAEPKQADAPKAEKKAEAPKSEAKAEKPAAKSSGSDDLTKLTGIGKVGAGKLNEAGFNTYADLAALSQAKFEELDAEIFKGRVPYDQLVKEAKDLA